MVRYLIASLMLIAALSPAHGRRVLEQPERPYELSLADVNLPSTATGPVTLRRCATCPYSTHVLTSATQFIVNDQSLPFADFSRVAEQLRTRRLQETTFVGVFVDVDSGRVTRITLLNRSL